MSSHDEWKATWDWAKKVWAPQGDNDHTFNWFFGRVAQKVAEAEGWEELGSSDVWHASYDSVKRIRESGEITTRTELMEAVLDYSGYFYGTEKLVMVLAHAEAK